MSLQKRYKIFYNTFSSLQQGQECMWNVMTGGKKIFTQGDHLCRNCQRRQNQRCHDQNFHHLGPVREMAVDEGYRCRYDQGDRTYSILLDNGKLVGGNRSPEH